MQVKPALRRQRKKIINNYTPIQPISRRNYNESSSIRYFALRANESSSIPYFALRANESSHWRFSARIGRPFDRHAVSSTISTRSLSFATTTASITESTHGIGGSSLEWHQRHGRRFRIQRIPRNNTRVGCFCRQDQSQGHKNRSDCGNIYYLLSVVHVRFVCCGGCGRLSIWNGTHSHHTRPVFGIWSTAQWRYIAVWSRCNQSFWRLCGLFHVKVRTNQ